MPRPTTLLQLPQPCAQSWDAMTPSGPGRHCAACQKVVVDFTQKTDAEILAVLAQAAGETCGRFYSDQLNRPLWPVVPMPPRPVPRWSAWLALLLATVSLRPGSAGATTAPVHYATQPIRKTIPRRHTAPAASRRLRGVVRDAATQTPLPGVAVFLKGENRAAVTDSTGSFSLRLPAGRARRRYTLVAHFLGYHSETVAVPAVAGARPVRIGLRADPAAAQAVIVGYGLREQRTILGGAVSSIDAQPPLSQPATDARVRPRRSFWRWLTQPFRQLSPETSR